MCKKDEKGKGIRRKKKSREPKRNYKQECPEDICKARIRLQVLMNIHASEVSAVIKPADSRLPHLLKTY